MDQLRAHEFALQSESPVGRYRATVPLINTWVIDRDPLSDDRVVGTRHDVGGNARVVELTDSESRRLRDYWRDDALTTFFWRLEVEAESLEEIIVSAPTVLDEFSLVVRAPLQWRSMPVDRFDGDHWVRHGLGHSQREIPGTVTRIPVERFETLRRLREGAGDSIRSRVALSLSFYAESVRELWAPDFSKAMTLAATSLECLLGDSNRSGQSSTLAARGALLTAEGDEAIAVAHRLKKLYAARSRVVHEGGTASFVDLTHLQQYLMRAIPSMIRLSQITGSHEEAIKALDRQSFVRQEAIHGLHAPTGWWSYVNVHACFRKRPVPRGRHENPGTYWWFESLTC